jgi:hypothetical protein
VLLEHLARVVSGMAHNKMDTRNLAIVFGEDEMPKQSAYLLAV